MINFVETVDFAIYIEAYGFVNLFYPVDPNFKFVEANLKIIFNLYRAALI